MRYLRFFLQNRRFIAFGFLMSLGSSFGQTFFIALFGAEIRGAFDLGHGAFGTVYALATLTSAAVMVPAGQLIDRVALRRYSLAVAGLLALACLWLAIAPPAAWPYLFIGFFLLRFAGQGLMSHTSVTSMARYFDQGRGRAIALASLGFAAGEAALPLLAVTMMGILGWRQTWGAAAAALAVVWIPSILWLLRGHAARHAALRQPGAATGGSDATSGEWSRQEILRDGRFYLVLPALFAPSFMITGLFFHQVHLVDAKGWPLSLFAGGFVFYAGAVVACSLLAGAAIDRLRAGGIFAYALVPLALGLLWLSLSREPMTAIGFMTLAGCSTGMFQTASSALWAELYGQRHLGAIRAMVAAVMVFSSALSPAVLGWLIDAGVTMEAIAMAFVAWVVFAVVLARFAMGRRMTPRRRAGRMIEAVENRSDRREDAGLGPIDRG